MLTDLWIMPGTGWTLKSYGFMMMVGFLSSVYLAMRRATRVKCDPDVVLNCSFIALLVGIAGARIFFVVHYWKENFAFRENPMWAALDFTQGGLEFLGGLVPAMIFIPVYLRLTGRSVRVYTDVLAVSTVWALGISRVGCFLNGCCFGGLCVDAAGGAASSLAVEFPYGSPAHVRQWEERRITLPAELLGDAFGSAPYVPLWPTQPLGREALFMSPEKRDKPRMELDAVERLHKRAKAMDPDSEETARLAEEAKLKKAAWERNRGVIGLAKAATRFPSRTDPKLQTTYSELRMLASRYPAKWVHPTQLYSAVSAILLSLFLGCVFYRRKRHGVVFGLLMATYPLSRFPLEIIRVDNPLDVGMFTVSQVISLGMFGCAMIYLFVLYKFLPERSPRAIPFVEEAEPTESNG